MNEASEAVRANVALWIPVGSLDLGSGEKDSANKAEHKTNSVMRPEEAGQLKHAANGKGKETALI